MLPKNSFDSCCFLGLGVDVKSSIKLAIRIINNICILYINAIRFLEFLELMPNVKYHYNVHVQLDKKILGTLHVVEFMLSEMMSG